MHHSALICLLEAIARVFAVPVVRPTQQQIAVGSGGEVVCTFPTPLDACRIRVSEVNYNLYDALQNFDQGAASVIWTFTQDIGRVMVQYAGAGLDEGDCGLRLHLSRKMAGTYQAVLVQCFGRSNNGSWSQGIGLITAHNRDYLAANSTTPHLLVARPETDVPVLLTTHGEVRGCGFAIPPSRWTPYLPSKLQRYGAGAVHGECGALVTGVQQKNAGVWRWGTTHRELYGATALRAMVVLVEYAPQGKPILRVRDPESLRVGGVLTATCRAPPSVPPAQLTWVLGGRVVRQDTLNETETDEVGKSWPWLSQPSFQTLTLVLSSGGANRTLECWASHPALASPAKTRRQLRIAAATGGLNPETTTSRSYMPTPRIPTSSSQTPTMPTPRLPTSKVPSATGPTTPKMPAPGEFVCPPLPTYLNGVRCVLPTLNDADCGNGSHPLGTQAYLVCNAGFLPREGVPTFLNTTCTPKGWRPRLFVCDIDCGVRGDASQNTPGGKDAQLPEFPWHVAVFEKYEDSYDPICGGALISINFFVSAAHCFYDDATATPLNASMYAASVGKRSLDWETTDRHEQRRTISAIHIPVYFSGSSKRLESDLALVQLSEPVDFALGVSAACVDWRNGYEEEQTLINSSGVFPGWGIAKNHTQSTSLRPIDAPFAPFRKCRDAVTSDFEKYLILDKMCGGSLDRLTPVCQGDAGTGYVFPLNSTKGVRYFVRGVLSSAAGQQDDSDLVCQDERMATFTVLSLYVAWIKDFVKPGADDDEY